MAAAYRNSLRLAVGHGLETVAFPNISTGIYGFPKDRAAEIAVKVVKEFLSGHEAIRQVTFVCFDDENFSLYMNLL